MLVSLLFLLCLWGQLDDIGAEDMRNRLELVGKRSTCFCGISTPGDRVVGGMQVPDKLFPWLVAIVPIYDFRARYCDGSLVSTKHIVTAYHCLSSIKPNMVVARLGVYDFNQVFQKGSLVVGFSEFLIYQQTDGYYNDLAVAVLAQPITFSVTINPICLPPQGFDYTGVNATVAGWGETSYRGQVSRYPQAVVLPVANTSSCVDNFKSTGTIIRRNELCAGDLQGGKDACQGDSGGPLMYFDPKQDRWVQIGVVSFGVGCATKGFYGVYTNLSFYSDNLQASIDNNGCILTEIC